VTVNLGIYGRDYTLEVQYSILYTS